MPNVTSASPKLRFVLVWSEMSWEKREEKEKRHLKAASGTFSCRERKKKIKENNTKEKRSCDKWPIPSNYTLIVRRRLDRNLRCTSQYF